MSDIQKDPSLSTAELAAVADRRPVEEQPPTRAPREYEEPPREVKKPVDAAVEPTAETSRPLLFSGEETQRFRADWNEIQIGFVDQPRAAVERADGLVAQVIKRLAEVFAEERARLESAWGEGSDVSTEDLRVALQRYRSFFDRLLSV